MVLTVLSPNKIFSHTFFLMKKVLLGSIKLLTTTKCIAKESKLAKEIGFRV